MKKVICYERRTTNSARIHYNRQGDWRPRLIVWPEYDGKSKDEFEEHNFDTVDDETDTEWGQIVAGTLAKFQRRHSLVIFAFELVWPSLWERITSQYARPRYKMNGTISPTPEYINMRQGWSHETVIFLVAPLVQEKRLPHVIHSSVLDRANLLPYGEAIFEFGIEEAVLEIAFDQHEASFVEILRNESKAHGHLCEESTIPFISHWVVANSRNFGENWRVF